MHTRLFSLFTSPIGSKLETFLVDNAQNILKIRVIKQPLDVWYLAIKKTESRIIEEIDIASDTKPLIAHRLKLIDNRQNAVTNKKAIIYLSGNDPFVSDSLQEMEPFLRNISQLLKDSHHEMSVDCYFQHYRGRGANQHSHEENFNDYPILQDARDQALLVRKLVEEQGYQPQDIILFGYSFGSAVALWTVLYLVTEFGMEYANLKLYSDRGYGNLFEFPYIVKPFIYDQEKAHHRLYEKKMMPIIPLHDIAAWLPDAFISRIEHDRSIWTEISLANTFKTDEITGRVWVMEAEGQENAHYANRDMMHSKVITELKPYHFTAAMISEMPIDLHFDIVLPMQEGKPSLGYALNHDVTVDDHDFVALPEIKSEEKKLLESDKKLSVTSQAVSRLITQLHEYCCHRAERAVMSGYGGDYNKAWLSQTGLTGWTARQQVQTAVRMITNLCNKKNPDIESLRAMQQEAGPHHSGELGKIFADVMDFVEIYSRLQCFNQWIISMTLKREERKKNHYAAENDFLKKIHESLADWQLITNNNETQLTSCTVKL